MPFTEGGSYSIFEAYGSVLATRKGIGFYYLMGFWSPKHKNARDGNRCLYKGSKLRKKSF